jgi:hypothetical protein
MSNGSEHLAERPKAETFWNGEPAVAVRVRVIVGESPMESWWCADLAGTERDAVRITYPRGTEPFYIDDEGGIGWAKVTAGRGAPTVFNRGLPVAREVTAPDYVALVVMARDGYSCTDMLHRDLADAVEALLAVEQRLTDHIVQLAAERDALQAENEKLRAGLALIEPFYEQRLVGPWTVVPEDAKPADLEPYVHPQHGRAAVPHTGTGWKHDPRTVVPEGGE